MGGKLSNRRARPIADALRIQQDQALCFRARRGHLIGPGAPDAVAAARAVLGAQAQQLGPGLLALSQRTRGRPTATALQAQLLDEPRALVRAWGPRETLHIYDVDDWSLIAAARPQWAPGGRRGPLPDVSTLDEARRVVERLGVATRTDLLGVAPAAYEDAIREIVARYFPKEDATARFAAGRLLWCLGMRGDLCLATKRGAEQAYAARTAWFPALPWPARDAHGAATELTRRYLRVAAPATARDVAHYFGARMREASAWLVALRDAGELIDVACGDRAGLFALAADADELAAPAAVDEQWPLRLLPQWDTYLMGHADKSWTVATAAEHKRVWRSAAQVAAAVVVRGRVVAEWKHAVKAKALALVLYPLSGWQSRWLPGVRREARAVAAHLGLADATVSV